MKKIIMVCFLTLILCGCSDNKEKHVKTTNNDATISCNKKDELLNDGALLIDVRTEEEYNLSHLDNAINIPVDEILDGLISLDIKYDEAIVVYCASGHRSVTAYNELIKYGYTNVYDLGPMSKCSN